MSKSLNGCFPTRLTLAEGKEKEEKFQEKTKGDSLCLSIDESNEYEQPFFMVHRMGCSAIWRKV